MNDTPARWLSVSEAALLWGTSARTVRRGCAAGTIPARRVGSMWQVESDAAKSDTSANDRAAKSDTVASVKSAKSDTDAAISRPSRTSKSDKSATDLTEHLLAEVAFLRAALEQRDRDAAELRAALRAALKLTAGTSAPQLEAGAVAVSEREQSGAANNVPSVTPATPETPQMPEKRGGAALSYGDIADELERNMRK